MKGFIYELVSKDTNEVIDIVKTREQAREIKRYLESGAQPELVKIVQYTPIKVVR